VRRHALALVILLLAPIVAGAPPPGQPEVSNDTCSTWNSSEGICDDYQSILDPSPGQEWMRATVEVESEDAEMVIMTVKLAVHEMSRQDLGLEDLELGGDSTPLDGIPADYIRNYQSLLRSGSTVSDRMIERVEEVIEQYVDVNFPTANTSSISTISEIDFRSQMDTQCVYDSDQDSIDEVNGMPNDPFYPPLCFASTLLLQVDSERMGMEEATSDLNRMMEGILVMGAEIESHFTASAAPGHAIDLSIFPPDYAMAKEVEPPGQIWSRSINGNVQKFSVLSLDNTESSIDSGVSTQDLITTLKHRPISTQTVSIDSQRQAPLDINLVIDARDSSSTRFDLEIGIHHLSDDTLSQWGMEFYDGRLSLPWVTSDGIRMFDQEFEQDLSSILDGLPVSEMSQSFSEAIGTTVDFSSPFFVDSTSNEGLMFRHIPGETCDEALQVRYCIDGADAMGDEWPVLVRSTTPPSQVRLAGIIGNLLSNSDGDASTLDLSKTNDEDLASLLSLLELNIEMDVQWLRDIMPENIPEADLTISVFLPEWLDSTIGEPDVIVIEIPNNDERENQLGPTRQLGFVGSSPFEWEHPICLESDPCEDDSPDLICAANQKTCVSFDVTIDIEKVAIHELSSSVSVDFDSEVVLEIYRLGIDPGEEEINLLPVPSDALRRIIVMGDRLDGGLLAGSELESTIDIGLDEPIDFEISNDGIQELARILTESSSEIIEDLGEISLKNQDLGIGYYTFNADFSQTPFAADFSNIEMRNDPQMSDRVPLRLSSTISNAEITMSLRQQDLDISIQPASIVLRASSLLASSYGMPFFTETGMQFEGASVTQRITPLMEHTSFGTIRSSARFHILMPDSVRIVSFESEMGLGEIGTVNGRQVLNYSLPICPEAESWAQCSRDANTDKVTYSVEVTWIFLVGELAPYALVLLVFISLSISRIRRKRKERKERRTKNIAEKEARVMEVTMEREFGKLEEKLVVVDEQFFDEADSSDENGP
tara:strand:- start:434 stop:3415 length:2982 start_codon:yes stop_codon:yes gene_type:complete